MKQMTAAKTTKLGRGLRMLIPVLLGLVVLLAIALPSWRASRENHRLAEAIEIEMSEWEDWILVSESIEHAVDSRSRAIDERWTRFFPEAKGMDALFLDLARIADDCELREFFLAEVENEMEEDYDSDWDDEDMDEEIDDVAREATALSSYRIRTRFEAELGSTANFLAELNSIPRSMKIRNIVIQDSGNGLLVEMEMELYVSIKTPS